MIDTYIRRFKNLRIDKAHGIAPHKPILLLSIIEQIEKGSIDSNKIYITPELIGNFRENWSLLVVTQHSPNFVLPFFHLQSDKFWRLTARFSYEKILYTLRQIRSFNTLNEIVEYAEIDYNLFLLLSNQQDRDILKGVLLDTYFCQTKERYIAKKVGENSYLKRIEEKIIKESPEQYQKEFEQLDEEEIFIRGNTFKKVIPRIYNYTCCISGLRIDTPFEFQMIDACHIVPFSVSHDDTISNGISFCPNLHRAFDKGLFSISDNYKVIVSDCFSESIDTDCGIKRFAGKQIILPQDSIFYPKIENLRWHRMNRFR